MIDLNAFLSPAANTPSEPEIAERLQWLLRLRWLIVPVFVAVDLVSSLLLGRRFPWTALLVGAALLAANGVYAVLLGRTLHLRALLRWARVEAALVVALPVVIALLHRDPGHPLRYAVLVGVIGAAAVLPRAGEVAVVGIWAVVSLVLADAVARDFDPALVTHELVARWALESAVVLTVAVLAGHLHARRDAADAALARAAAAGEHARAAWDATFDAALASPRQIGQAVTQLPQLT